MVEAFVKIKTTFNLFLYLFMIALTSSVDLDSSCPERLNQIFLKSAPIGNATAGKITGVNQSAINTLELCIESCCTSNEECNVVFFYNKTCYHVMCHSNEICLPLKRNNIKQDLAMVLVKPVFEGDPWEVSLRKFKFQQQLEQQEQLPAISRKGLGDDELGYGQYSDTELLERKIKDMYTNYESNFPGELQYGDLEADESRRILDTDAVKPCIIGGKNSCTKYEVCRRFREEPGRGYCECLPGYHRGRNNLCVKTKLILEGAVPQRLMMKSDLVDGIESVSGNEEESNEAVPNDKKKVLTVSVASKTLKLPENGVALSAFVIPDEKTSNDKYAYLWTLISQPKPNLNGTMTDQSKDKVRLTNLSEGTYQFKCQVTGTLYYGEALANVTVLAANRMNKAPQVMITPSYQTVKLPNHRGILDGSGSTDDGHIESYTWEIISAPIGYQSTKLDTNMLHESMLQLDNLDLPGNYTFKFTVTDSEQKSNSTTATIEVLKEIDYPPNANAGTDIIVYYPQTNVTLNGSLSTDDHEITAWEWTKDSSTDQSKPVDMTLTRSPYLQLSNLEVGVYTFLLKVMDAKNQSSTSKVRVFVKPALTNEPNAVTGSNQTIILPQNWALLNGTESTDDVKIERFEWKQLSGPSDSNIVNASMPFANATNLKVGKYMFQLTVFDNLNNNASALANVTVKQEQNAPPISNAGGDQTVTLPMSVVVLNGSRSSDDLEITKWVWERDGSSLAMGTIIGNSSYEPALMLTNVVPGRYVFKLTVNDAQGLSSSDTVSIFVNPDPLALNLVELTLTMEANFLRQSELDYILQKVMLLLGDDIKVTVRDLKVDQKTGKLIAIFYATKGDDQKSVIMPANDVERILKEKFLRDYPILGSSVLEVRTSICQNNCSGHGACNSQTRVCMCDSFWLPDLWYFLGVEEPNCNWSILYVVVGVAFTFILISGVCFAITYFCRRRSSVKKPSRSRRPVQKYTPLDTHEEETSTNYLRNNINTFSEESDTESDILFETRSRNGILKSNGDTNKSNGKYSMTRLGRKIKA